MGPFGKCTLFNIYNDGKKQDTLQTLEDYLTTNITNIRPSNNDHMLWLGDFNRHHPLWEEERNDHLMDYTAAQPLIDLLADHGMNQSLPKGEPTLQASSTGNWTRPDNVFCTDHTMDFFTKCNTNPALRGPKTDHVPIHSILELTVPRTQHEPTRNFRDTDWEQFRETLAQRLDTRPAPSTLTSDNEFQLATRNLALTLDKVISETTPLSKNCPHSKRWWTRNLTLLRRNINKASHTAYKMRGLPLHPSHNEFKRIRNQYAEEIFKSKKQHWTDWLEEVSGNDIWIANKYITSTPTDGSKTRIPTLSINQPDGSKCEATSNAEKSIALAKSFFPPQPNTSSVPPDFAYPTPVANMTPITSDEIHRNIRKLSPYKAPGPDGICNIVFKQCADLLVPFLLPIFNASISLRVYYQPWRQFTTVVLRKPGKPDYTVTKAYRPIALLNTTCKLLTAVIADQMTYYLERHQLLPATHFGGRPGRSTTDSLHLLEETIKNAWRTKKVASVLFLDIEGAFPNAVTDRLLHNMKKR
jgi:hypothetical protein